MFYLILSVTLLIISKLHLLVLLAPIADFLHSQCVANTPLGTADEIVKALVCAEPIQSEEFKNFFFKSSLFHLIVVSKTHFVLIAGFVSFFLQKLRSKYSKFLAVLLAILYALLCKLQAPLIRSLTSLALSSLNAKFKLNWSSIQILMISAFICLSLNPLWIESLSLLHSVSCALAFVLVQKMKCSNFQKHFYAYALTVPFLFGWGSIHPTGLIVNILIAPILILTWIPFAYLVFLIHPLMPVFDAYISFSIATIQSFLDSVELLSASHHIPTWILWSLFWGASFFAKIKFQILKQHGSDQT